LIHFYTPKRSRRIASTYINSYRPQKMATDQYLTLQVQDHFAKHSIFCDASTQAKSH